MKKVILLVFLFINSYFVFAQINFSKCNTTKLVNQELKTNQDYLNAREGLQQENNNLEKTTITIPIVIHIIHRNSHANIGTGTNISKEQVEDQLRILNEDYSKTNPEYPTPPRNTFLEYWGNPDIEFCLATTDPNGNSSSGITRTSTAQINRDADEINGTCHEANGMKKTACGGKDGWDPSKYLNIWVCDLTNSQSNGMTLGYAYLPGLLANPFNTSDDYKDGLVVDYRYFGTIGIAAISSDGRTPTHEIGHYLGLMHTFCEDSDSQGNLICCDNDNTNWGGYVDDTPAVKDIYFGAVTSNTNNNTCNDLNYGFSSDLLDMDENYMSYASNTWMFSQGQVDVMLSTLNKSEMSGGRLGLKNSNVSTNCSGIISSVNNLSSNINISLYPNPTSGKLNIYSSRRITSIAVYNIVGKKVFTNTKIENKKIDLYHLKSGVYFIDIKTDQGVVTKKIIISK